MCGNDSDLRTVLRAAEMNVAPDPARIGAVQAHMAAMAQEGGAGRRSKVALLVGVLVLCAGGIGLGATEAGRDLVRRILTPVFSRHEMTITTPDGSSWSRGGSTRPYGPAERRAAAGQFAEIAEQAQAGLGDLVGLLEGPQGTAYQIRYTLADGSTPIVSTRDPHAAQALMMRLDEIQRLRDAGAGTVIVQSPSPYGLGFYTIRLALPDRTVDLETWYPPGPRSERDAIFDETRRLKNDLRFTVLEASRNADEPDAGVMGTLRYTLADGRTVGIVERIPDEIVAADGEHVVVPGTGETVPIGPGGTWWGPEGDLYVSIGGDAPDDPEAARATADRFREIAAIRQAGGGTLVGLLERPGSDGEAATVTFQVLYQLADGETTRMSEGELTPAQRVKMHIDEILRLRDAGAGEIVDQHESPLGLGGYTIRFTLADGETVDLRTIYPPGTDKQRAAIFAETRDLRQRRRFTVLEPRVLPGAGVWALHRYALSDGRTVTHFEPVPTDLITNDGRYVATPGTGELVEIERD